MTTDQTTRERHWWVVSPAYDYTEPVLDDGSGPTYTIVDAVSVAAPTRREAIRRGVKAMRYWPDIARRDLRANPFSGVIAKPATCEHGVCMCEVQADHGDLCEQCVAKADAS